MSPLVREIRTSTTDDEGRFADLVMSDGALHQSLILGGDLQGSPISMGSSGDSEDSRDADDELGPDPVRRLGTDVFSGTNTLDDNHYTEAELACLEACKTQKEVLLAALVDVKVVDDPEPPKDDGPSSTRTLSQRVGTSSNLWNSLRASLYDHFRHISANLPDDDGYRLTTRIDEPELVRLADEPLTVIIVEFNLEADFEPQAGSGQEPLRLSSSFTGTKQGGGQPTWHWVRSKEGVKAA